MESVEVQHLDIQTRQNISKNFAPKAITVSIPPTAKEAANLTFVFLKQTDGSKLLKVMIDGELKQLYVDGSSQIYVE